MAIAPRFALISLRLHGARNGYPPAPNAEQSGGVHWSAPAHLPFGRKAPASFEREAIGLGRGTPLAKDNLKTNNFSPPINLLDRIQRGGYSTVVSALVCGTSNESSNLSSHPSVSFFVLGLLMSGLACPPVSSGKASGGGTSLRASASAGKPMTRRESREQ